jgi:PST family polysaccharide transporter
MPAPGARPVLKNVGVLFWSHIAGLVAAFVTVPYLAQVLRPESWGQVLLAQALSAWLLLLLEYAFDLSVARRLADARARHQNHSSQLAATVRDAMTARGLLTGFALLFWASAVALIPPLRVDWRLTIGALIVALARGLTPLWYFLGVERVGRAVFIDTAGRVIGALALFGLVTTPQDGWWVTTAQAFTALVVMWYLNRQLHTELPALRRTPGTLAGGTVVLREGFPLFAARASGALYMQLNTLLLGVLATPAIVAMFGGAERIVRAGVSLLDPATRALVARLSYLQSTDARAAHRLAARLIVVLTTLGAAAATIGALIAPWLITLLLGPGYEAAVPVFRRLLLLLPIIAAATAIGIFSAVPRGHDRIVLLGTLSAGATNLLLVVPLTRRLGAEGMALSVVTAEAVVAIILAVWYWRQAKERA